MKLIGGVYDGREIGNQTLPVLQAFEPLGDPELTFYRARKFYAEWPIPGWEMVEIPPDLALGEKYPTIQFRIKNYFTEEAEKKVQDFIESEIYMRTVLYSYSEGDMIVVNEYMEKALQS